MAFDLAAIMDALSTAISAAPGSWRCSAFPVANPTPPQAVVGYPLGEVDYDLTFHAAGTDGKVTATIPVWFVCGKVLDKAARDQLSQVITGAPSLKRQIETQTGGVVLGGAVDYATVARVSIEQVTVGDIDYLQARFDVEVCA